MSLNDLLAELPALSLDQRHQLIRRALELDDQGLSGADEAVVERRLAEHRRNPASAVSIAEMNLRLRSKQP
jgi:hypothetical protein